MYSYKKKSLKNRNFRLNKYLLNYVFLKARFSFIIRTSRNSHLFIFLFTNISQWLCLKVPLLLTNNFQVKNRKTRSVNCENFYVIASMTFNGRGLALGGNFLHKTSTKNPQLKINNKISDNKLNPA